MENSDPPAAGAPSLLRLAPGDNVLVAVRGLRAGEVMAVEGACLPLAADLGLGHKVAARAIASGEKIIKCNAAIGSATRNIAAGEHVHLHNMKSDYLPTFVRAGDAGPPTP